jgi:8-oxo-dGTP pyrophosphatase MutT (NUDIX family)
MVQLTQSGGDRPVFPITAKAVIPLDGKVLLLRRLSGKWDLPGGKLDSEEDLQTCLVRECLEELGFVPKIDRLLAVDIRRRKAKPDPFVCFYLCRPMAPDQTLLLSPEHDRYDFVGPDGLAELKLPKVYRNVLRDYFKDA